MSKGGKIALIVVGILATAGIVWWAVSSSSRKSGVREKDDRRITFTKD